MKVVGVMIIDSDTEGLVPLEFGYHDGLRALRAGGNVLTAEATEDEEAAFSRAVESQRGRMTALEIHRQYPGIAVGLPGPVPKDGYKSLLGVPRG